jgi:hypothetical protein
VQVSQGGQSCTQPKAQIPTAPVSAASRTRGVARRSTDPPTLPGARRPNATGASEPLPQRTSGHDKSRPASRAKEPNQERPSGAGEPTLSGGKSRTGPTPGRCAARKVWTCEHCGVTARMSENGRLEQCRACESVRYCGKACQAAHWPAHKATCKHRRAVNCKQCGATADLSGNGRLEQCSGCHSVRYCGKACQAAHWPAHKATCKRGKAMKCSN